MKRMLLLLLVLVVAATQTACREQKDPLVGKWSMRTADASEVMELTEDHKLLFGENNGTWDWTDDDRVLLEMKSGKYLADFRETFLHFVVGNTDVVLTKIK